MVTIKIEGLQETTAMLDEAKDVVKVVGMTRGLQAAGNVISRELYVRTPVKKEDTGGILDKGELRESQFQNLKVYSSGLGGMVGIGFREGQVADWVERGHLLVSHGGKVIGAVPPHPFIRPAFDASAEAAIEAFGNAMQATVQSAFPGLWRTTYQGLGPQRKIA